MSIVFHQNLISKLLVAPLNVTLCPISCLKGIVNMTWAPFVVKMQKHQPPSLANFKVLHPWVFFSETTLLMVFCCNSMKIRCYAQFFQDPWLPLWFVYMQLGHQWTNNLHPGFWRFTASTNECGVLWVYQHYSGAAQLQPHWDNLWLQHRCARRKPCQSEHYSDCPT